VRQRPASAALLAASALSFVQATGIGGGGKPRPCELITAPDAEAEAVEAARAHVFERLTPGEAARLEGKRALYRVSISSHPAFDRYELDAPDGVVGVLAYGDRSIHGQATVEAVLHLDYVPPRPQKDGVLFPGAWRYRLEDAAVVEP
jgi:hypothetical protein